MTCTHYIAVWRCRIRLHTNPTATKLQALSFSAASYQKFAARSHSGRVHRADNPAVRSLPHGSILTVPWVRIPPSPPKQDSTLTLLFLSGLVPVRAFALWTHARIVFRVSRYPNVIAPFACVLFDSDFSGSHARTIYLRYIPVK